MPWLSVACCRPVQERIYAHRVCAIQTWASRFYALCQTSVIFTVLFRNHAHRERKWLIPETPNDQSSLWNRSHLMSHHCRNAPPTVFTPLEYALCHRHSDKYPKPFLYNAQWVVFLMSFHCRRTLWKQITEVIKSFVPKLRRVIVILTYARNKSPTSLGRKPFKLSIVAANHLPSLLCE